MSVKLMSAAWDMALPMGQKMLLLALCDHANDDGVCYPSQEKLAQKCSMGERTVISHIQWLERHGIVSRERRQNTQRRKSDLYQITLGNYTPEPANSAPANSAPAKFSPEPANFAPSEPANFAPSYKEEPSVFNHQIEPSGIGSGIAAAPEAEILEAETPKSAKPKKTDTHSADLAALANIGVETQLAKDWLQTRKEKRAGSLTQTVIAALQREAEKAGLTVPQAVQVAAERGWARFHASYLHNETQPFAGGTQHKPQPRNNTVPKHENGGWQEWK